MGIVCMVELCLYLDFMFVFDFHKFSRLGGLCYGIVKRFGDMQIFGIWKCKEGCVGSYK